MACILLLAIQAVRVCVLGSAEDLKPSALERAVSDGTRLSLTGTVEKIEEKKRLRHFVFLTVPYLSQNSKSMNRKFWFI